MLFTWHHVPEADRAESDEGVVEAVVEVPGPLVIVLQRREIAAGMSIKIEVKKKMNTTVSTMTTITLGLCSGLSPRPNPCQSFFLYCLN